jgi:two-component system, cell cycle sensor histidine kinase and response regulator CckA
MQPTDDPLLNLVDIIDDYAIFILDPKGNITTWNAGAARIYGYSAKEAIGQHLSCFFTPVDVASGVPQRELDNAVMSQSSFEEAWRVRKDGSRFWAHGTITAIFHPAGHLTGFLKIVRDLTESQRKAEVLQLRDRAMQAVSQGILITDATQADNPIVYANNGFEHLTGYRTSEVLGRNCRLLQGSATDPDARKQIRDAIAAGKQCDVEILNYRKNGSTFWNAIHISPVKDDDGVVQQFIGVQIDVTQRRTLEAQLRQSQKLEAIGQLAGGIAHDFNNLLTIISGYSEILLAVLPPDDVKRASVRAISEAGERAAGLTRQLLAFSSKSVLEPRVLDLNGVVIDTEKMLRRLIGEDVTLTTVLDPHLNRVKVDKGQIGQVLMNLSVNARDAMPKGGTLTIETRNKTLDSAYTDQYMDIVPGSYVLLTVSDSGSGMTSEVKSRLFEPFFTTKGVGKGTGLGLAVVHGIVKQSNGQIGVYSELGLGTSFKIYLPAANQDVGLTSDVANVIRQLPGTESILLVEDEDSVRELAVLVMQAHGYTVTAAANGKEALRIASGYNGEIDILLTDVVMPEMSGPQLADTLKPRFPRMKVLYVSGYTDDAVVRQGILQSEVAFLEKPYSPRTLLSKVRQVLEGT